MKFPRSQEDRDLVNMTPLIDVVFILLVFFMLAGVIKRPDTVVVEPPKSQAQEEGDEAELVILISADGSLVFDSRPMPSDDDLLRNVQLWLRVHPSVEIQLKADAGADAARVIRVMDLLRQAGAKTLVLLTVGGEG